MGVYSCNRSHLGTVSGEEIVANENYIGGVGALQMTLESLQNDQAIFEAVLGMDFQEAVAVNEGVSMEVFTEASVSSFIEKIKEFVKKAWEKIKGLFQTFLTKFNGVVMRDNKAFVDKYKKAVSLKDLSKMKYKWAEPKKGLEMVTVDKAQADVAGLIAEIAATADLKKINEELDNSERLDAILSKLIGTQTDSKEFNKDMAEQMFEDVEEEEGLTSARLSTIISVLSDKKIVSNIEKARKDVDKYFSKLLADINKVSNKVAKDVPSDKSDARSYELNVGGNASHKKGYEAKGAANEVARLNTIYKAVSVSQTGLNKYIGRFLEENKNYVKQCRRVFAQAAAFNPKAVKENAVFVEAAGDAAEYELSSLIESYEI